MNYPYPAHEATLRINTFAEINNGMYCTPTSMAITITITFSAVAFNDLCGFPHKSYANYANPN